MEENTIIPNEAGMTAKSKMGWRIVIFLAVIWVLLILVYVFVPGKKKNTEKVNQSTTKEEIAKEETPLSTTNDPESLTNDLNNTNTENLDLELGQIESQL